MFNVGTGQEHVLQFYYDKDLERCVPFFYKGDGGNGNRFATELQCMGNCSLKYLELYPEGGKTLFNHGGVKILIAIGQKVLNHFL